MNKPDRPTIRDTLFGDLELSEWARDDTEYAGEPWQLFLRARKDLEAGNRQEAIRALEQVAAIPSLESRHYLQAWSALRSLGVRPDKALAGHVYGVVAEVAVEQGQDIVAGYADHTARYFNFSGAGIVWDAQEEEISQRIDQLLTAGETAVKAIGLWEAPRPPAPTKGQARISMLTPAGLYFGEAPTEVLWRDPLAGPVIDAAFSLMQALISRAR